MFVRRQRGVGQLQRHARRPGPGRIEAVRRDAAHGVCGEGRPRRFDLHGTDWTKYSSKVHADTAKEKVATYGRDNCQPMAPLSDAKKRQYGHQAGLVGLCLAAKVKLHHHGVWPGWSAATSTLTRSMVERTTARNLATQGDVDAALAEVFQGVAKPCYGACVSVPVLYKVMLQRIKEGGQGNTTLVREFQKFKTAYTDGLASTLLTLGNTRESQEVPILPGKNLEPVDRSIQLSLTGWTSVAIAL